MLCLRSRNRRWVGSASAKHVMPMLCDVTRAMGESDDVRLNEAKLSTGYICRCCFRDFEKIQKLQQQVKSVYEHLYINAKTALPYLSTVPASSQSTSQTDVAHEAQALDDN